MDTSNQISSNTKAHMKHIFQTMCISADRNVSLSMYKAVRNDIRNVSITKRDVQAWLRTTGIDIELVDTYTNAGSKVYCVYVYLPHEWECIQYKRHCRPHIIEDTSYAQCIYKLAFKVMSYKWDMTLSQIHEVENWSFPKASRTDKP